MPHPSVAVQVRVIAISCGQVPAVSASLKVRIPSHYCRGYLDQTLRCDVLGYSLGNLELVSVYDLLDSPAFQAGKRGWY